MLRGDFSTASSVMFLLGFGEILEDWTHKKSVDDLARSMSLNVSKVWLITEDSEVQVGTDEIKPGDRVRIHMGTVIPFDGIVTEGEAMVNEASLTGGRNDWSTPARIYGGYYDQALSLYAPPTIQAYTPPRAEIEKDVK